MKNYVVLFSVAASLAWYFFAHVGDDPRRWQKQAHQRILFDDATAVLEGFDVGKASDKKITSMIRRLKTLKADKAAAFKKLPEERFGQRSQRTEGVKYRLSLQAITTKIKALRAVLKRRAQERKMLNSISK